MKKILFLALLMPFVLKAQETKVALIDSFMRTEVAVNGFNGNVLVAKDGNIVYQNSFGFCNFYTKEKLDNNSVFDLASISKQFTAMGVLILKEKGKLSLSDTLRKFFPELPYNKITIKHLLTHTSGLPEYVELMMQKWDKSKIAFNKDVIELIAKEKTPVSFQPGEKWEYCNTGYMLLASIIEKVSGKSFNEFMRTAIFKPLGMNNTKGYNTRRSKQEKIPDYAYGFIYSDSLKTYIIPDSSKKYDVVRYLDGIQGDGTINSTTGDLLKYNKLLSNAMQTEMLSKQAELYGGFAHYGYGVMINNNQFGTSISHSGNWPGYANYMIRYLDKDITIIVLCNAPASPSTISSGLTQILYDKTFDFPYIHKEIPTDTIFTKKCVGKFFFPSSGPVEILENTGKLFLKIYGGRIVECKQEAKNKFFFTDPVNKSVATLEFEPDDSGEIKKIYHTMNYVRAEIKKQ